MNGKKDRMGHRASWRRAATCALAAGTLVLSLGGGAIVRASTSALADETPGQVTIEKTAENHDVTYDAHLLFTGHVGTGNKISEIAWKDKETHDAVVGVIQRHDASWKDPAADWEGANGSLRGESAQLAAEYIARNIADGKAQAPSTDATLVLDAASFGDDLAEAVEPLGVSAVLDPGKAEELPDGYYLFATTPGSLAKTGQTGTSPIFAVVGDQTTPVTVREKASVPAIGKHVRDDSTGTFGYAADMHAGQQLAWRLTGTVADDIAGYKKYSYRFVDTIDKGLTVDWTDKGENSVRVYLHHADEARGNAATQEQVEGHVATKGAGTDVTRFFETMTLVEREDGSHVLTVGSYNIKKQGIGAQKGDWFTVEYTCTVNADSVLGNPGNDNVAKLVYSNNPLHSGKAAGPDEPDNPDDPEHPHFPGDEQPENPTTGESVEHRTRTYVYTLNLHKQDKQNAARALQGAKFTIKVVRGDDPANPDEGKYVQADGSLAAKPHEFTTDAQGNFAVKNIDRGTYLLQETEAPLSDAGHNDGAGTAEAADDSSYEKLEDATIVIGSNVEELAKSEIGGGTQLSMTADAHAPEPVFGSFSDVQVADSVSADGTAAGGVHADSGSVNLVVREAKETRMPLTGGAGIALFALLGSLLIGLGALLLRGGKSRSREDGPCAGC